MQVFWKCWMPKNRCIHCIERISPKVLRSGRRSTKREKTYQNHARNWEGLFNERTRKIHHQNHSKIIKNQWANVKKLDAFKNWENMASHLPVGRQNSTQSAQRRDLGIPNGYQNPPLEPPDFAPGQSHFGFHFKFSLILGIPRLDIGSPRADFWSYRAWILEVFPITVLDPRKRLGCIHQLLHIVSNGFFDAFHRSSTPF